MIIIFLSYTVNIFSQNDFELINTKTEKLVYRFLEKENIPGASISISYNDTLIFSKGFGYADVENKITVDPSKTKFRIASITKTLTAATIIKLSELGLVDIHKSIHFYLDSLPRKEYDFTIAQIGGHISGIRRVPSEEKYTCDNIYGKKDFYRVFKMDSLLFKPSTNYSYSNYGYQLLGILAEKITGQNIVDSHKKFILNPLNLENIIIDTGKEDQNTSKFYVYNNKELILAPCLDCSFRYACGCYLSTSEDLIKLGNAYLYVDRFLKKESILELITSKKLTDGRKTNYGFGFTIAKDYNKNLYYGHNGGNNGNRSLLRIYPKSKLVITILVNTSVDNIDDIVTRISYLYIDKIQ
jgi:serine beta-lactamase-like protein LACTB